MTTLTPSSDASTQEGNIGPVGEALAEALGVKGVIPCPAFPTVGRTVPSGSPVRPRAFAERIQHAQSSLLR